MLSRILNPQILNFLRKNLSMVRPVVNGSSSKNQNAIITKLFFFYRKDNFFSKKQLQRENSGFVKTCDENVHNFFFQFLKRHNFWWDWGTNLHLNLKRSRNSSAFPVFWKYFAGYWVVDLGCYLASCCLCQLLDIDGFHDFCL